MMRGGKGRDSLVSYWFCRNYSWSWITGGHRTPDSRYRTPDSRYRAPDSIDTGHQTVDTGHQTVNSGHQTVDTEHHTVDTGHQTVDKGHQTVDTEHQTVDTGHQTVDTGHQIPGPVQDTRYKSPDTDNSTSNCSDYIYCSVVDGRFLFCKGIFWYKITKLWIIIIKKNWLYVCICWKELFNYIEARRISWK